VGLAKHKIVDRLLSFGAGAKAKAKLKEFISNVNFKSKINKSIKNKKIKKIKKL
jgi:hypothetical protein